MKQNILWFGLCIINTSVYASQMSYDSKAVDTLLSVLKKESGNIQSDMMQQNAMHVTILEEASEEELQQLRKNEAANRQKIKDDQDCLLHHMFGVLCSLEARYAVDRPSSSYNLSKLMKDGQEGRLMNKAERLEMISRNQRDMQSILLSTAETEIRYSISAMFSPQFNLEEYSKRKKIEDDRALTFARQFLQSLKDI